MAVKKVKQPGVGTQEPMKQEHSQQQANTRDHEATQCDKTAETKQREKEWVQMFQKMFHRVRMWMRPTMRTAVCGTVGGSADEPGVRTCGGCFEVLFEA